MPGGYFPPSGNGASSGGGGATADYDSGNDNNGFTAANATVTPAPWAELPDQTGLLDLTDPTQPTVLADGLYMVQATISADSNPVNAVATNVVLGPDTATPSQAYEEMRPTTGQPATMVAFKKMAAGEVVRVNVRHTEGADAIFYLLATVARIA